MRDRDKLSQHEPVTAAEQLAALARLDGVLGKHGIPYWLFGGWAVDFHTGSVTRSHDDLDIAVWSKDHERIAELLATDGWQHTPDEGEDGYTAYTRGTVRLGLALLARDQGGTIYTPLREGRASWPEGAFEGNVAELRGVRARVITLAALKAEKSQDRDDPVVAAKDSADVATLLGSPSPSFPRKRNCVEGGSAPAAPPPPRLLRSLANEAGVALVGPDPSARAGAITPGLSRGRAHRPCHQRAIHTGHDRSRADNDGQHQSGP